MLNGDIIKVLEQFAPPALQESWDNTGLQVGSLTTECRGILICFDVTPAVVSKAIALDYNLIISHHPLFFRGVKRLTGETDQQTCAIDAICAGITIYSSHTALDSTLNGVSYNLSKKLGLEPISVIDPNPAGQNTTGLGILGKLDTPMKPMDFALRVKGALGGLPIKATPIANDVNRMIERVAVCGGAGQDYIEKVISLGAQAYVTAELKYHDFVDYQDRILLIDAGHYETEAHIKQVIYDLILAAFPEFHRIACTNDDKPIIYI